MQLVQLQKDQQQFQAARLQIVAISYDSVEVLSRFAKRSGIEFPLLSDEKAKTIDAYKVRDQGTESGSRFDGIPIPTTFVIGEDGIIKAKLAGSTKQRHSTADLLKAAKDKAAGSR